MLVKLESVSLDGTPHPLTATGLDGARVEHLGEFASQQRVPLGSWATLSDPNIAIFEFGNAPADFVIRSGLESDWIVDTDKAATPAGDAGKSPTDN
jgi:hypothetical protein